MVLIFGPWIVTINCPPESFFTHTREICFAAKVTPVYASWARRHWLQNGDNLRETDHVRCSYIGRQKEIYQRIKERLERNRPDIRRLKVTEIYYKTVATSYKIYIYIYYLFI